jgi:hypothetical protein
MHTLSPFEQLLQAASEQIDAQHLLFVFAGAELPQDATPAQRQRFAAGAGGSLAPLMCVAKALHELTGFDELVAQSRLAGPPWQVVFAAGLSGLGGRPPTQGQVDQALQRMTERVRDGMIDGLLALAPTGEALQFFQPADAASVGR